MDRRRTAFGLLGDTLGTEDILNTPIRRGGILPVTEYPNRTELDLSSGLTGALWDAFTAPDRARRGEISESDMIPEAFNFAGSLTLGSLLAPRPTGSVGMGGRAGKEAIEAKQPQGIRAFHGSPHDFERFDMSKIGTGEGAQAYGHGLYFAEAEDVARSYRDQLAPKDKMRDPIANAYDLIHSYGQDRNFLVKQFYDVASRATDPKQAEFLRASADAIKSGAVDNFMPPGHMYEVNIKANPEDFLDWDKPLSQQSEKVLSALSTMEHKAPGRGMRIRDYAETVKAAPELDATRHLLDDRQINVAGSDIMNMLGTYTGHGNPDSTKALREAGIPGIRYLDQMSRGAGEGSSNYVVFDDALVEILRKYGLLGPVAGIGAAGLLADDGGQVY